MMNKIQLASIPVNYKRLSIIITVYLGMFFFGFSQGCDFVARPMVLSQYPTEFSSYVSYIYPVSLFIGAVSFYFLGMKKSILIASLILCLGSIFASVTLSTTMFICSLVILSISYGCYEISLNSYSSVLFSGTIEARLICWLHFFFALGEVVSTSCATNISQIFDMGYHSIYAFMIAFAILYVLLLVIVDFKIPELQEVRQANYKIKDALHDGKIWFFVVMFTLVEYVESFLLNDVLTYIVNIYGNGHDDADILAYTQWILYFYAGSRLFLGYFVDRIGHFKSIFICFTSIFCLLLITAFCGYYGVYVVVLTGIFVGLLYPTIFTIAMDSYGKASYVSIIFILVYSNIGEIIAKLFTTISVGVGGYYTGITFSIVFCVIACILVYWYSTEIYSKPPALTSSLPETSHASTVSSITVANSNMNTTVNTHLLDDTIESNFASV